MTEQAFDPWAQAYTKQDEQKKAQEDAKNNIGSYDFEEVVYEGLAIDKAVIFRIMGNPPEYRQNEFDGKLVLQSRMVRDGNKSKVKINWKYTEGRGRYIPDPDWILTKLYNKAMEKEWVKFTESEIDGKNIMKNAEGKIVNTKGHDGKYVDLHQSTKTYARLKFNKLPTDKKSFGDASPSVRVILNVISRMDDWCKENQHTKILATKVGISEKVNDKGETQIFRFPETGISQSMYADITNYTRQFGLNPTTVDIVLTRTHTNDKYSQTIFDGAGLLKLGRGAPDVLAKIVEGPLSPEELAYERYDLDKLFSVSSYRKLKKNLTSLFKEFDVEFNQNLYEELCALALEEEKNADKDSKESDDNDDVQKTETTDTTIPSTSTAVDPPITEVPKAERVPREAPSVSNVDFTLLPFWASLDADDKADMTKAVVSITGVDDVVFQPNTSLVPCTACQRNLPNTVLNCPICGTAL